MSNIIQFPTPKDKKRSVSPEDLLIRFTEIYQINNDYEQDQAIAKLKKDIFDYVYLELY